MADQNQRRSMGFLRSGARPAIVGVLVVLRCPGG